MTPRPGPLARIALTALIAAAVWAALSTVTTLATAGEKSDALRAAAALRFSESFDDAQLAERGWYDGAPPRIAKAPRETAGAAGKKAKADAAADVGAAPFRGAGCIEYEWAAPAPDGANPVTGSTTVRHLFEPSEVVYLRYYVRLSKGWGWTGKPFHPHLTHFMTTENDKWRGPAASHLTVYVEPVNGKLRLAAQDIQNADAPHGLTQGPLRGGYNGRMFDSANVLFSDDAWHCVEACFQLNTLDLEKDRPNADGVVRGWFDGKLVIEHTDVVLRSTDFPKMKFNQFLLAPYFGKGLLPHAQSLWIDELAVGVKRIGMLEAGERAAGPAAAESPEER